MEVKIGVQSVHRELVVETDLSVEELEQRLLDALPGGLFAISDGNGRRLLVPASSIGFVEVGEEEGRKAGFGTI